MKRFYSIVAATAIMALSVQAAETKEVKDGVSFKLEDRIRYEGVTQNNATTDATASTNRFLLGLKYKSGDLSLEVEGVNVSAINDKYDDTDSRNGKEPYSIVVDPEQSRMTQAKISYQAGKTAIIAGRQMINIDNQRFVGAVAWRQMFQTFDAFVLQNKSAEDLTLTAAYIAGVNGIKTITAGGADGRWKTKSAVLNANYKANEAADLTAYGYLLGSVHDTYGLTLKGKASGFSYRAEYAVQTDASIELDATTDPDTPATGPARADASYINIDLAYTYEKALTFGLNYEVLSGDDDNNATTGTTAFSTPLATGHKFNGWADIFLTTPSTGLIDANARLMYKTEGFGKLLAVYHKFDADKGPALNYGKEVDLIYTGDLSAIKGLSFLIKYADFKVSSDYAALDAKKVDTKKFWASLSYKFASN